MTEITSEELAKVNSFPRLVELLRDKLEWPIPEDYGLEDVVFEYEPHELGLKDEDAAKLREIHQLRPLVTGQPWGVFFLSFEKKAMSVTVLRRILRKLVLNKRDGAQSAERAAWLKEDLIFAANFGKSGERELAFIHFSDGASTGDLPVMKVLGWNARDTVLHNRHAAGMLSKQLGWPDDPADQTGWRSQWASAFEVGHREVITTSQDLAKRLAALAGDIRARANQLLAAETAAGRMRTMLEAFRKNLIHDLDEDGFADMFAQTICYGMLAARISRPVGIIADNLADMVPKTNPFLKELFGNFLKIGGRDKRSGLDFDELGIRDVVDMLNRANMEAVLRDFGDRNPKEDPVIHFYELFLKEYDPQKRMQRGVFYTPRPVVNFIVRGVDEILRTEFDLPLGLADTSTWSELAARNDKIIIPDHVDPQAPFVQILDPATGTGTFLVEVIDLIHTRMVETWEAEGKSAAEIKAAWNTYVPQHLLPRLTAFELMMAPYAIAHMKIGLKLVETGYTFGSDERAHVFLTNALEPPRNMAMEFDFASTALAHEANAANEAKSRVSFTVVVGNPPYASTSSNLTPELRKIVDPYRYADGEKIKERSMLQFEKNIQDDYIKFIRMVESQFSSSFGVVSMITNHSYIDGITLRGMRQSLLETFSTLKILDLHGNANKNESKYSGETDKNIFPTIAQGVAIFLGSALGGRQQYFAHGDLWGGAQEKEDALFSGTISEATKIAAYPKSPNYYFRPLVGPDRPEWDDWRPIDSLFGLFSTGVETGFDELLQDFSDEDLVAKLGEFDEGSKKSIIATYDIKGGHALALTNKKPVMSELTGAIHGLQKNPFDYRPTLLHKPFLKTNAAKVFANVNCSFPALVTTRQTKEHFAAFAVGAPCGHKLTSGYDRVSVFPSMFLPDGTDKQGAPNVDRSWAEGVSKALTITYEDGIPRGQQGNLGKDFIQPKAEQISLLDTPWDGRGDLAKAFGPRDLFDYIYAVLHAPTYRSRYAEFLKSDFPRIPTPGTRTLFATLVPLGRELVALHLLKPNEAPVLKNPQDIRFAGTGEARVGKGYPEYSNGKVMINDTRWFEDVPKATWEFHVGGYQPCEKWLKDRAAKGGKKQSDGRVLTDEDILHYRRMVTALTETRRLMAEIDKVIESHGGWPGAFKTGD